MIREGKSSFLPSRPGPSQLNATACRFVWTMISTTEENEAPPRSRMRDHFVEVNDMVRREEDVFRSGPGGDLKEALLGEQ